MIGRRQFITVLGGAAAWPLAALAHSASSLTLFLGILEQQFGSLRQAPWATIPYNRQRAGGDAQATCAVMMVTTRDIEALAVRLENRGRSNLLNAQPDLQADLLLAARLIFTWMDEHPFLYGVTLADESGAS